MLFFLLPFPLAQYTIRSLDQVEVIWPILVIGPRGVIWPIWVIGSIILLTACRPPSAGGEDVSSLSQDVEIMSIITTCTPHSTSMESTFLWKNQFEIIFHEILLKTNRFNSFITKTIIIFLRLLFEDLAQNNYLFRKKCVHSLVNNLKLFNKILLINELLFIFIFWRLSVTVGKKG